MRATLIFDTDVANLLDNEVRKSGEPFERVVNRFLRLGLRGKQQARKPFVITPINLGLPAGYYKVEELLEYLEGPDYW